MNRSKLNLNALSEEFKKLPAEQIEAILKIIQIKTDNDMNEFLHAVETFGLKFEESEKRANLRHEESQKRQKMILWVVSILTTLVLTLLGLFLKK